jgi:hypothetical protein
MTASTAEAAGQNGHDKKQILLNAFDMSTVGHLSPGQWKVLSISRKNYDGGMLIFLTES